MQLKDEFIFPHCQYLYGQFRLQSNVPDVKYVTGHRDTSKALKKTKETVTNATRSRREEIQKMS